MTEYKSSKLTNESTLIVNENNKTEAVSVCIYFGVGSRFENNNNNGISHFIEHMFFKGTNKRPSTYSLSKELDSMGAIFNAYTAKDATVFYIKVSKNYLESSIEILADIILNSTFKEEEIEKEKGVIIQEVKMYEDRNDIYVDDIFEKVMFGEEDEIGRLILGTEKNIANFTREDLINFKNLFYRPDNMTISISGSVEYNKVESLVNKYFKFNSNFLENKEINNKIKSLKKENYYKKYSQDIIKINIINKNIEQVNLVLGFPIVKDHIENEYIYNIISTILGGNMSSRLFTKIREKNSLCYSIRSSYEKFQDIGILKISSGLDKNKLELALKLIKEVLDEIVENGFTQEELENAKSYICGSMDISSDDTLNVAEFLGRQFLSKNKALTIKEKKENYKKITQIEINDKIKEIINYKKLNINIIGSFLKEDKNNIINIFK